MTNDKVDQKFLCFLQDVIVNSADTIKSCFSPSCCEELNKIEDVFPSTIQPNNPEAGNWIAGCVSNLTIDQTSKAMLLLKINFAHWLSLEFGENIH